MTVYDRSAFGSIPGGLAARFSGTETDVDRFLAAYAAWRREITPLASKPSNNVGINALKVLEGLDRAKDIIAAGRGQEMLYSSGKTRVKALEDAMRGLLASFQEDVPTKLDLFTEAVVQTALDIRATAVAAAKEGASLTKWLVVGVVAGSLAYVASALKVFK